MWKAQYWKCSYVTVTSINLTFFTITSNKIQILSNCRRNKFDGHVQNYEPVDNFGVNNQQKTHWENKLT